MKYLLIGIIIVLAFSASYASSDNDKKMMNNSKITESYVMLYYKTLEAPRNFYGETLGLETTFEDEWVTLYRITPSSYVGVVKEGGTAYHSARETNAVMLSLVVDNVDSWYEKIKTNQNLVMLKEIYNHESAPIRAFLVEDPGGYTVEIFQWVK